LTGLAPILEVDGLDVVFPGRRGVQRAVSNARLAIRKGETLGLVGESGCGKSTLARAIIGLVPEPGRVAAGSIRFDGIDLLALQEREMRKLRGGRISMVFQNPMSALNPVLTIGQQIAEALAAHTDLRGAAALDRAAELLDLVGIPDARGRLTAYPHQFSGGMRQRVMIAIAISCNPDLVIADEPTTALDVTVQTQILDLLASLRDRLSMAILLVSHDMGVVAGIADRVHVMYSGYTVEHGSAEQVLLDPLHPYTSGLLKCVADIDAPKVRRLPAISGSAPSIVGAMPGCPFEPRCGLADGRCAAERPSLEAFAGARGAACWKADVHAPA